MYVSPAMMAGPQDMIKSKENSILTIVNLASCVRWTSVEHRANDKKLIKGVNTDKSIMKGSCADRKPK